VNLFLREPLALKFLFFMAKKFSVGKKCEVHIVKQDAGYKILDAG
jgi:hypothetical protein